MSVLASFILFALSVLPSSGSKPQIHHLYRDGEGPDTCHHKHFSNHEWTGSQGHNDTPGRSIAGTNYALRVIYKHQHPMNCSEAKFLVWVPTHHGIGSNIHVMGGALAHALSLGRVLVLLDDEGHPFYDTQYCEPGGKFHECYFEPLSSCTIEDVKAAAGMDVLDMGKIEEISYQLDDSPTTARTAQVMKLSGISQDSHHVPRPFEAFLAGGNFKPDKHFYWWRSVATAYIVRPNPRTLDAIEARKQAIYPPMSVPLGATAVHVRHGDKWKEHALAPDAQFHSTLEALHAEHATQWHLTRNVFLSTEDAATVEYFGALPDWNVTYTHVERYRDGERSPVQHAEGVGKSNEMLNSLVSLDLALECEAFVVTLTSNWCRLIDELRATVRCKADRPLLDAQQDNTLARYELDWR